MVTEIFDSILTLRINSKDLEKLKMKSNNPYQMTIREMIKAFNDDRLRIIPTNEQKKNLKIYQIN